MTLYCVSGVSSWDGNYLPIWTGFMSLGKAGKF